MKWTPIEIKQNERYVKNPKFKKKEKKRKKGEWLYYGSDYITVVFTQ